MKIYLLHVNMLIDLQHARILKRSTTPILFNYIKFVVMAVTPTCREDSFRFF